MTAGSRRIARLMLAPLLLLCAVPLTLACDKGKQLPKQVRISVVVILASENGNKIDKKLEGIATEVQKIHPKLKNFQLARLSCKSVAVGKADIFDLVDNQTTNITIQKAADKMDRIRLKVGPPQMGEIIYTTTCGKFLPILTPYRTKKDEVLIIAVRVQPCNGGGGKVEGKDKDK
jgi:hypothetical protein